MSAAEPGSTRERKWTYYWNFGRDLRFKHRTASNFEVSAPLGHAGPTGEPILRRFASKCNSDRLRRPRSGSAHVGQYRKSPELCIVCPIVWLGRPVPRTYSGLTVRGRLFERPEPHSWYPGTVSKSNYPSVPFAYTPGARGFDPGDPGRCCSLLLYPFQL